MQTITADLLKVAKIASKDPISEIITGVLITPTHFVATDSYSLLMVEREGLDESEFPKLPNSKGDKIEIKPDEQIVIPAADLLKKQKFNKNSTLPVLDQAIISDIARDSDGKISQVEIATTDLQTATKICYRNLANERDFPQYEEIIPKDEPKARIKIDPKKLIELLSQFDEKVELEFHGDNRPLILKENKMLGCFMPLKF